MKPATYTAAEIKAAFKKWNEDSEKNPSGFSDAPYSNSSKLAQAQLDTLIGYITNA